MKPIHIVELDKARPAVILTRSNIAGRLKSVTVAPITTTIRGIATEVPVGPDNGLTHDSVISFDNVTTVPWSQVRPGRIGSTTAAQDQQIAQALLYAYDLDR